VPSVEGVGVLNTSGVAVLVLPEVVGVIMVSVGVFVACGSHADSKMVKKMRIIDKYFIGLSP